MDCLNSCLSFMGFLIFDNRLFLRFFLNWIGKSFSFWSLFYVSWGLFDNSVRDNGILDNICFFRSFLWTFFMFWLITALLFWSSSNDSWSFIEDNFIERKEVFHWLVIYNLLLSLNRFTRLEIKYLHVVLCVNFNTWSIFSISFIKSKVSI